MESYVCKLVVLQTKDDRILKPRKVMEEDNVQRTSIKKCLFGVSSPKDTEKMVREQFEIDSRRFSERFGIDLRRLEVEEDGGNDENDSGNARPCKKRSMCNERRILKASRRVFKPCNGQSSMTDFYQTRKCVQSAEKSPKNSSEK